MNMYYGLIPSEFSSGYRHRTTFKNKHYSDPEVSMVI